MLARLTGLAGKRRRCDRTRDVFQKKHIEAQAVKVGAAERPAENETVCLEGVGVGEGGLGEPGGDFFFRKRLHAHPPVSDPAEGTHHKDAAHDIKHQNNERQKKQPVGKIHNEIFGIRLVYASGK
ncbi:MAG: hypothetical protein LBI02_07000 [Opitutaceae bacterium]|nr:hypothetical protein [Opitutaceae bacterium]